MDGYTTQVIPGTSGQISHTPAWKGHQPTVEGALTSTPTPNQAKATRPSLIPAQSCSGVNQLPLGKTGLPDNLWD